MAPSESLWALAGQVAMLFLSRGELFHEAAWALWFKNAAGLLPVTSVRNSTCTPPGVVQQIAFCTSEPGS